ncbi:MAG: hypothetical protein HN816_08700, partial [Gammaproteobacteria bacterium]|nr:hypothetical protein [Gammaproteobacteria bacterium]
MLTGPAETLIDAIGNPKAPDLAGFDLALSGVTTDEACDAGLSLLGALAATPTGVLVESGRIVFDTTDDECMDSVLDLTTLIVSDADADEDGCLDQIWDLQLTAAYGRLPSDVQVEVDGFVASIIAVMLPPFQTDPELDFAGWAADRETAPAILTNLTNGLATHEMRIDAADYTLLQSFISNTFTPVAELGTCWSSSTISSSSSGVGTVCDEPDGCIPENP